MSVRNKLKKDSAPILVDVVIPVLNEAHVLEKSVGTVRAFLSENLIYEWNVVLVDNGSTDGTFEIAQGLAARNSDVRFVHLKEKGRGRALRKSWKLSPADFVMYMDVDLSTELSAIPLLFQALIEEGNDISIGSRMIKGARTKRCLKREVTSRIYNLLLKVALSVRFKDAQCGFKAVTRRVIEELIPQVEDQGWFFDTELLVLAELQGYKIREIPVTWIEDDDSRVKIIPTAWQNIKGILRLRKIRKHKHSPASS
jgi:glycosyltransferase involved in cell wall biosynthesis